MDGACSIDRGKAGDEVVFESGNGAFGCIDTVVLWWHQLYLYIVAFDKCCDRGGAFIVHHVEVDFDIIVL